MINLFQVASDDASLDYLSQIFGSVSGVIGSGGQITILSTMFKTFNSVILTVAVLMLVYITIIGVIGTAHEGEFMGKKMNNIWIPIRSVLGIALLVPTGAGYCGIQIIMMWVIVQGIGAADTLWNTALSYVSNVGSVYGQVKVPGVNASQTLGGLFQGLVCDASSRKADPANVGNYYCVSNGGCGGSAPAFNPSATTYSMGPNGACGSITYCNQATACAGDSNSLKCLACQAQTTALAAIIPTLGDIAQQLVNADYSYRDFYANSWNKQNNASWNWIYSYCASPTNQDGSSKAIIPKTQCCVKGNNPFASCQATSSNMPDVNTPTGTGGAIQSPSAAAVQNVYWPYWPQLGPSLGLSENFVKVATNYYLDLANGAVSTYIAAQGNNSSDFSGLLSNASNKGWIYGGGFYYEIARMNSDNLKSSIPDLTWNAPDMSSSAMKDYRNNFTAAKTLESVAAGNYSQSASSSGQSAAGEVANDVMGSVTEAFTATVTAGGTNPLILIQVFGVLMLIIAEIMFVVVLVVLFAIGISGNIDVFALGTGVIDPLGPMASLVAMFVIPGIYAAFAVLITLGGLLGIYTPLIPYVYFTFGAIGWMISTVETMVAGPLVALGVISPSGHHEILGKAEPALMLLFNVFLRPSLMIFGLISAMLLAVVVVTMINETFAYVVLAFVETGAVDPLSLILILSAYVGLILAALNKCFAVINVIPQQVMRWIGGQGEGVEAPLQEIKGGIQATGGKAGGGMESTTRGTAKDFAKGKQKAEADANKTSVGAGDKKD
ncbi:hypothetical protein AQUSIP_03750 [Aquicella siphonis]|uniref:Uncharacterized protein n=1 Tax=Aquicella siphonis TaxID=254247 RepID=A0A5E4PDR9_9COXI|nr:DotA/TraY family protein [Aquicella siphonis]VVC75099.1 hypothetical protein AQUSIP_03750 [Aquicella siphonis]